MTDRIVIDNAQLARRLQRIAEEEQRPIQDVLASMVSQYQSPGSLPAAEELARQVRKDAYRRARDYWRSHGPEERASLTDEQMDEQFWLFDADGVPRLKVDRSSVHLPKGALHHAGQVLSRAGFRSGRSDISARSREILASEMRSASSR